MKRKYQHSVEALFNKRLKSYPKLAEFVKKSKESGCKFFSLKTIKYWGTELCSDLYQGNYFITSDWTNFDRKRRMFSIRKALDSGNVETISLFHSCTLAECEHIIKSKIISLDQFKKEI